MPSSIHQAKRPYAGTHSQSQSSITSYFTPQPNGSSRSSSSLPTSGRSVSSPPLPELVQSNLLSVGMRVRKSVPEGYKTGSYSAFELFSDNSKHYYTTSIPEQQQEEGWRGAASAHTSIGYRGSNELAPFCGIMRVGGLGVQDMAPAEEDLPFLSSQGSTASNASARAAEDAGSGNKRRFDEEDEQDGLVWRDPDWWSRFDGELSPKSRPGSLSLGDRAMAIPRSKRKGLGGRNGSRFAMTEEKMTGMGQENVDMSMDFEEAEFLDYGVLEVDMDDV